MKLRVFAAAFGALLLAGVSACVSTPAIPANPPNVLDAYVAKPDPSFAWKVEKTFTGAGYHGAVLELTSQTWMSAAQSDRPVWKHWLTVTIPDAVSSDKAFLYIGGGSTTSAAPQGPSERFALMAVDTKSVIAELGQTPNQPIKFADTPEAARSEDDMIAYLQARYDPATNPEALPRLPMVKSGTAAMTAVQQFLASDAGGKRSINGFVVSGGSKRGWTSWLVGLLDERVVGIIPIVINVLDVDATTRHHWEAMGYFSPALGDYVRHKLIPDEIGRKMTVVNTIEDPLNYRGRPQMLMPKFIINAVGDEFFPPDNTKYSYHLLPGEKQLRMLPNSRHSTAGTDINESMTAWYDSVIHGRPVPEYTWTVREDGALVIDPGAIKPSAVLLWQGTNPAARDFRVATLGDKAFTSTPLQPAADGTYVANVDQPATGFTAYFVELTYPSGTKYPFKFTTEVYVKPDVLPYRWEDARPITAPNGK
jgi:PhoPQ-activated pathogenicity-related protein